MSNHRVASRYAKSLMELAKEKGQLEEVHEDILALSSAAGATRELGLLLKNPIINSDKKLKVLKAVFPKANSITTTFYEIISRKNREGVLLDVAREFHAQYNAEKSIQVAELTTTCPIDDALRAEFKNVVKQISGLAEVELLEKVDPQLIGGYVLKVNDRQLDESLSSKLKALKRQFAENHYESKI